jgi:streptomycin 6-kinase
VLRRLHVAPPDGLVDVVDVARRWQATLLDEWLGLGRPGRRDLVERAVATCTELAAAPGAARLLHGDFHYGNVLARLPSSAPQGWAALDPKPLVGDRSSTCSRCCATASTSWPPPGTRQRPAAVACTR